MNIINKTLLVTLLLTTAHVLDAMERVPVKEVLTLEKQCEKALIVQLQKAVKEKNFERYFALIQKIPLTKQKYFIDINLKPDDSFLMLAKKAIHFAAEQGNTDAVRKLLECGAHVNDHDDDHMTPFLYAAKNGNPATIALLLEKGASVMAIDKDGMSALHWAAAGNHTSLLRVLITDHRLNIDDDWRSVAGTPLHIAAAHGHVPAITTLIELGARKDKRNRVGETALHIAAGEGRRAAVITLIKEHDFYPNAEDMFGRTSLFCATGPRGNLETFNALIECGARIHEDDVDGASILHYAATNNKTHIIISLIRDHGLNPNKQNSEQETPLGWAIENDSCLAELALLCMGASLTDEEKEIYKNYSRSCLRMLQNTIDKQTILNALEQESLASLDPHIINQSMIGMKTPLICAAQKGCHCVKLLLKDRRIDPNLQDHNQETAFHHLIRNWQACRMGRRPEICSLFLNLRRTNIGLKDKDGKTARDYLSNVPVVRGGHDIALKKLLQLFELRKMHVQAYLSLKNARCSQECSEEICSLMPQLPADVCFKIVGLLTEEALPIQTK